MQKTIIIAVVPNEPILCIIEIEHDKEIHPQNALKAAVTEWVDTTPEGKNAWEETSHDFNFGDLLHYDIPNSICEKHGFRIVRARNWVGNVLTNHDEILVEKNPTETK